MPFPGRVRSAERFAAEAAAVARRPWEGTPAMADRRTVVFVHGAWVTPGCFDRFGMRFEARGHPCLAPAWPYDDRPVEELRADPAPELAHQGVTEIVDHYDRIVRAQPEPPILVGHSFGGLFVQMLLDRGLGAAGVALDPAPPRGVLAGPT